MAVRWNRIRKLTQKILEDNDCFGPPVHVDEIIGSLGLRVKYVPAPSDKLSGLIKREARQAVIGVNENHPPLRQRFTMAHELGHYLLHVDGAAQLHIDHGETEPVPLVKFRDEHSSDGTDDEEKEANHFAAELLMPKMFIDEQIKELRTQYHYEDVIIKKLAEVFEVSEQAMTFRLANLKYITL